MDYAKSSTVIDVKFLQFVVPLLWEQNVKKTNQGEYKPIAVVHVDANITPSDVAGFLGDPLLTKIKFNYTGEVKLQS